MKIKLSLAVASTGNTYSLTVPAAATNAYVVTLEQLAATWNRPLEEIKRRWLALGTNPPPKKTEEFYKWIMANGMTDRAKRCFAST